MQEMNENPSHPDAGKDPELDAKQGEGTQQRAHDESKKNIHTEKYELFTSIIQQFLPDETVLTGNETEDELEQLIRTGLSKKLNQHNPNWNFTPQTEMSKLIQAAKKYLQN